MGYTMQNGRWAFTEDLGLLSETARTSTTEGPPVEIDRGTARLTLTVTAAEGTTPTLDVAVETRHDERDAWRSLGAFAQKTAPGLERKCFAGLDRFVRAVATLGGTAPSFTFSVHGEAA